MSQQRIFLLRKISFKILTNGSDTGWGEDLFFVCFLLGFVFFKFSCHITNSKFWLLRRGNLRYSLNGWKGFFFNLLKLALIRWVSSRRQYLNWLEAAAGDRMRVLKGGGGQPEAIQWAASLREGITSGNHSGQPVSESPSLPLLCSDRTERHLLIVSVIAVST